MRMFVCVTASCSDCVRRSQTSKSVARRMPCCPNEAIAASVHRTNTLGLWDRPKGSSVIVTDTLKSETQIFPVWMKNWNADVWVFEVNRCEQLLCHLLILEQFLSFVMWSGGLHYHCRPGNIHIGCCVGVVEAGMLLSSSQESVTGSERKRWTFHPLPWIWGALRCPCCHLHNLAPVHPP